MMKYDYLEMLKQAFKEAKEHIEPSPETKKALNEMRIMNEQQNIKLAKIDNDLENLRANMDTGTEHIRSEIQDIKDLINRCDNKYANKWAEKAIIWMVSITCGAVIIQLLNLIIKK